MNNKGFTMIELLAAVVVLGILMIVAVPTVTNVLNDSKNKTYIDDSIRLISTFDNQMRKDNMMPVPAINCCIAMNLTYLDNNTFDENIVSILKDISYDQILNSISILEEELPKLDFSNK